MGNKSKIIVYINCKAITNNLNDNERKQKKKEVENCKSYLIQHENASKAFEMVNTLFKQPKDGNGVLSELFMELKD